MRKKGENHSDPIYTNPIKNLPRRPPSEPRAPKVLEKKTEKFLPGARSQIPPKNLKTEKRLKILENMCFRFFFSIY